jgi:hypothetical protein
MLSLLDLVEKARNEAAKLPALTGKFVNLVKDPVARVGELIEDWGERIWGLVPPGVQKKLPWLEGKPGFLPVGLGLVLAVLLAVLIGMLAAPGDGSIADRGRGGLPGNPGEMSGLTRDAPIPAEDLFLPNEPDFLPGVVPGREQRSVWTAEDAEPYWYNPLEKGEEEWRNRIRTALDEFLENVP